MFSSDVKRDPIVTSADADILRIIAGVGESVGPLGNARAMPPAAYTSQAFFEFEQDAIFGRSWVFLCHESEIPNPGDYHAVSVVDEPLIVTRDEGGQVHVLSAVCQHRGYVIAEEDGSAGLLRCPYHSWSYGLDGRLRGAPSMGPLHDLDELKRETRLPQLRVELWHGMVFANFDTNAAPLAPSLARLEAVIAGHRLEDLTVARSVYLPELPFNWKNMQENALEEYHTTFVHKGYHENAPAHLVEHGVFEPGDGGIYRHAGLIIRGGEDVPGRPTFPVIDGLPERERGYMIFVSIPPSFFAVVYPHGLKLFRILPQSANEMTLKISFVYPTTTFEVPGFDDMVQRAVDFIELIDRPDIVSNTRIFKGLQSRFAPRGRLSPQEATLPQFNQWLFERYEQALGTSPTRLLEQE